MTTPTAHTCDCDHGEPQNGRCGAPAPHPHYCIRLSGGARTFLRLCDPCNTECHNREHERW